MVRRRFDRLVASLLGALALPTPATIAPASAQEALPREWNQAQGNAQHTAFVDVAPIKSPPQEAWRVKVGELLADPVVSQGKLYALARDGKGVKLVVLDAASGAVVVRAQVDPIGDVVGLAAVDGLVVVVGAAKLLTCRLAGDHVRWEKSVAGPFVGPPTCFPGGALVEAGGGDVAAIDLAEGKSVAKIGGWGSAAYAPRQEARGAARFVAATVHGGEATTLGTIDGGGNLELASFTTDLGTTATPGVGRNPPIRVAPIQCDVRSLSGGVVTRIAAGDQGVSWYAWIRRKPISSMLCEAGRALPVPLKLPPAVRDAFFYGFDTDGQLVAVDVAHERYLPFIRGADLPAGAAVDAPSIARDVLYVGNWAVEIDSRRVLWCRADLKTRGPTIPVGDERAVVATADGQLVGLSNGTVAATPAKKIPAGAVEPPARAPKGPLAAPLLPGSAPGVVRADGLFVAGKVAALDGGRWRVEPEGAAAQELDAAFVAVADPGSGAKLQGDEYPLFRACLAALNGQHAALLVADFERWKERKFFDECRRVVEEARRFDLPPERADELLASIAGRKSTTVGNADVQKRKALELETAARAKIAESVVAAAKWCADAGAPVAATAVRMHESDFVSGAVVPPSAIADWIPPIFPFPGAKEEVAKVWANWAEPLLPSGARFFRAAPAEAKWLAPTPFADSVMVRTDHVVLFTLELDPKIIGPCLSRAEATVRTLKTLLGKSPSAGRPDDVLPVFLYSTRAQYLADKSRGSAPAPWTAGFYSPREGVSRFYARLEDDRPDPLGRSLYTVMAHELTHHYVDRVWNKPCSAGATAGYWMVEGFAEFVAGQQVEMDRLGGGLDDATALSLDLAAAAMKERQLLAFEFLLGLNQEHFETDLDGGDFGPVQARHTLVHLMLDRRAVFYEESGALTFFVMNRFGKKGRDVYVDWFARVCRAQPRPDLWKDLGFAEMADFEKAFRDFLAGL